MKISKLALVRGLFYWFFLSKSPAIIQQKHCKEWRFFSFICKTTAKSLHKIASIKPVLDTRKARKDGTYPLKLGVSHKGYFQISLGIFLKPEQWVNDLVVMPDDKRRATVLNNAISARYKNAEAAILRLRTLGELRTTSNQDLRRLLDTDYEEKDDAPVLFKDRYEAYVRKLDRKSTIGTYENMFRKLSLFADVERLTFERMTYAWLKDFEHYLKSDGLAVNSIGIYMRNICTIFNDAIDRDVIPQNLYPFRKFKIQKEATRKRALTVVQLREFRDHPAEESQKQYQDIFMLIFYLGGINIIDLCNLRRIDNGYVEYRRAKTGRLYRIRVEPEALEIIERHRGKEYLLDILDRYEHYEDYRKKLNRNIREIGSTRIVKDKVGKLRKKEKTGLFPDLVVLLGAPHMGEHCGVDRHS